MDHYDFIIAGGGCAGLSLAHALIHSPLADRSILILDRDDKDQNDRTWAYWSDRPSPYPHIIHREWEWLCLMGEAGRRLIPVDARSAAFHDPMTAASPWRYVMIRGDDFYRHIRALLAERPNITWRKEAVTAIEDQDDGAVVRTQARTSHGTWIFDSLFDIHDFRPDTTRYRALQQHFMGWFIETPEDAFEPGAAILFDFRTPQAGEMRFFYVLPTGSRAALVEYVGLSRVEFEALLAGYIEDTLGVKNYRVVSDETGVTPLTDFPFARRTGRHIMAVGIQGGLVKPTTGYAYTRIQDDSQAIVRSLLKHGDPFHVPGGRRIYRWLDSVMLELMRVEPARLKTVFGAMFLRNPGPRIFRFLDERATPWDLVALVASLPKAPFLRAAARLTLRQPGPTLQGAQPSQAPQSE